MARRTRHGLARPAPDALEADFLKWCTETARTGGWQTYHVTRPERAPAGFPDLVLSRGDVFGVVELKRALGPQGGRTRSSGAGVDPHDEQVVWLDAAARARWVLSALWRPTDAERVELFLTGQDAEPPGLWIPGGLRRVNAAG